MINFGYILDKISAIQHLQLVSVFASFMNAGDYYYFGWIAFSLFITYQVAYFLPFPFGSLPLPLTLSVNIKEPKYMLQYFIMLRIFQLLLRIDQFNISTSKTATTSFHQPRTSIA
jgi:hypothetical protein